MNNFFKKIVFTGKFSISSHFRRKRMNFFKNFIRDFKESINILDLGGTQEFWEEMGYANDHKVRITLINIIKIETNCPNIKSIVGDATNLLNFKDKSFDVIFSNSLIEHITSTILRKQMVQEIYRVGKTFFIQTPNYYFPIEPHFFFPFFQFLPIMIKIKLVTSFNMASYKKCENKKEALNLINSIRLLKEDELRMYFPNASIYKEKIFGFTKSFIAHSDRLR